MQHEVDLDFLLHPFVVRFSVMPGQWLNGNRDKFISEQCPNTIQRLCFKTWSEDKIQNILQKVGNPENKKGIKFGGGESTITIVENGDMKK